MGSDRDIGIHQRADSKRMKDRVADSPSSSVLVPEDSCSLSPQQKKWNKFVYFFQSCLLGMSYSIIWPSVWPYIQSYRSEGFSSKVFYGAAYIAYPFASMLSSFVIKKLAPYGCSFKLLLLLLNCFEIVGSVVYTLPYHPVLPVLGRFLAGFGDVFYLLLAKEIAIIFREREAELITMQCLISFVIGVILAPGLSLVTWKINFALKDWQINYLNIAGLHMAMLFLLAQFIIMVMVTDISPYERCCREPHSNGVPVSKLGNRVSGTEPSSATGRLCSSSFYIVYVMIFAFIYGFSVGSFELILPMVYWENFAENFIGIAAIYAFMAGSYSIFLIVTVSTSYKSKPRLIVCIGLLMASMGQFLLLYYKMAITPSVLAMEVGMALLLAILWSIDDVLFIDLVTHLVPLKQQDPSHGLRRAVSKFAFATSGILVPLAYPKLTFIATSFLGAYVVLCTFFFILSYAVSGKVFG